MSGCHSRSASLGRNMLANSSQFKIAGHLCQGHRQTPSECDPQALAQCSCAARRSSSGPVYFRPQEPDGEETGMCPESVFENLRVSELLHNNVAIHPRTRTPIVMTICSRVYREEETVVRRVGALRVEDLRFGIGT